ncbi:hypothetical protein [Paenibacillus sp. GCM10028914]
MKKFIVSAVLILTFISIVVLPSSPTQPQISPLGHGAEHNPF